MSGLASAAQLERAQLTETEVNMILRGRQLRSLYPVDFDSMTIWVNGHPECFNGVKRAKYTPPALPFEMDAS